MTPEQAESLAECRRMLGVLLGWNAPTGPELNLPENSSEARRMLSVLLAARAPAHEAGEQSIPEQLGGESY